MDEMIEYEFDQKLLKRSLVNLIMNALVHNPTETEIWISLRKHPQIIIEIKDNGQGMNQEDLEQLFQRYYRGTNTINYQGSGLGRSIAKEVIEAHSGEIVVESQVNMGTVIKIFL